MKNIKNLVQDSEITSNYCKIPNGIWKCKLRIIDKLVFIFLLSHKSNFKINRLFIEKSLIISRKTLNLSINRLIINNLIKINDTTIVININAIENIEKIEFYDEHKKVSKIKKNKSKSNLDDEYDISGSYTIQSDNFAINGEISYVTNNTNEITNEITDNDILNNEDIFNIDKTIKNTIIEEDNYDNNKIDVTEIEKEITLDLISYKSKFFKGLANSNMKLFYKQYVKTNVNVKIEDYECVLLFIIYTQNNFTSLDEVNNEIKTMCPTAINLTKLYDDYVYEIETNERFKSQYLQIINNLKSVLSYELTTN